MQLRKEEFRVKTYDCHPNGKIKISTLMQYLQEIAANHAEQLGFGFKALNQFNSYWVLSNIRIEIANQPSWNEKITIYTWPSGHNRLLATREFIGKNKENCEVFKAASEWMILDKESSKPKNLTRLHLPLPEDGKKVLRQKMKRLQPKSNYNLKERRCVPYSAIDLNGHVNNSEYVTWAIDVLQRDFPFDSGMKTIQATYLSEIFESDEIEIYINEISRTEFDLLIKKSEQDINVFLMEVLF
ncbi:MAG: acyl-[acyl-carrier-protein] thioesterase [Planctomycetota bacterium]|jgi:acyl-ACP thioesterase